MAKVDILNYISDSNILRSTYDTDTNELDITDVPQNLNSVVTLGQGGGGPIELLNTIEVTEPVRAVVVDLTSYSSYDFIFLYEDLTLDSGDWLYYAENTSDPSGGSYSGSRGTHKGISAEIVKVAGVGTSYLKVSEFAKGFTVWNTGSFNSLCIYCYSGSNTIKSGSVLKIYGGKYADM